LTLFAVRKKTTAMTLIAYTDPHI